MTFLQAHPWLAGWLVMVVNIVIGRARMAGMIAEGRLTTGEADHFCIKAAAVLGLACALFHAVGTTTGVPFGCQLVLPIAHRRLWPLYALAVASGALLLYWVWRRGGDQTLAKVGPAFTRGRTRGKTYTPRQVRFWLTALPVVAWGGYVGMRAILPTPSPSTVPGCSEIIAAPP